MVCYPSCFVGLDLFLELDYPATQLDILGEHAGALIFQLPDSESADIVHLSEVSILAKELFADY